MARCQICEIPHKNTNQRENWLDQSYCRSCMSLCDYFSLNGNRLNEYWSKYND